MNTPKHQLLECASLVRKVIQDLMDRGETVLMRPQADSPLRAASPATSRPAQPAPGRQLPGELGVLAGEVAVCQSCELARTRKQTVFGEGDPRAQLVRKKTGRAGPSWVRPENF